MMDVDDFLEHYGVKGQKWGVRKRRNEAARKAKFQKSASRLSDKDLQDRIKRMELEKRYSDLNSVPKSAGKKFVSEAANNAGKGAIGTIVGTVTAFAVKKALLAKFGPGPS